MAMTFHTTGHATKGKSLTVLAELQVVRHNGRTYKLLSVQTHDGLPYLCLRLYNGKNHFIKQMLFEREVAEQFGFCLTPAAPDSLPACEISRGCYFGQDGRCLRGGECR